MTLYDLYLVVMQAMGHPQLFLVYTVHNVRGNKYKFVQLYTRLLHAIDMHIEIGQLQIIECRSFLEIYHIHTNSMGLSIRGCFSSEIFWNFILVKPCTPSKHNQV